MTISPEPIPDAVLDEMPDGFHILWTEHHNDILVVRSLQSEMSIVDKKALEALFK